MILNGRRPPQSLKPVLGSTLNANSSITQGLVLCYLGNEGAGNNLINLAWPGRANGSPVSASLQWTKAAAIPAPFGSSVRASTGLVVLANNSLIDGLVTSGAGQGFSALAWFLNTGSATFWQHTTTAGGTTTMWLISSDATNITFQTNYTNGGSFTAKSTAIPSDHGSYMHSYLMTYNGADSRTLSNYQWYVDGQPVTMTSGSNNPGATINTDSGGDFRTNSQTFSHFMLWNRVLIQNEILQLWENPFCFMAPNERSKLYTGAAVTPPNLRQNFYVAT